MGVNRTCSSLYSTGLLISLCFGLVIKKSSAEQKVFGSLRLCPPGGPGFVYAWDIACEMKKRKRRSAYGYSNNVYIPVFEPLDKTKRLHHDYRPATLEEMMHICCDAGCEIRDLLSYCNPFS